MTYPGNCIVGESLSEEYEKNIEVQISKSLKAVNDFVDVLTQIMSDLFKWYTENIDKVIREYIKLSNENKLVIHKMNLHNKKRRKR